MLDNLSSWISNATSYDVSKTDPNISGELSENVVDFLFDACVKNLMHLALFVPAHYIIENQKNENEETSSFLSNFNPLNYFRNPLTQAKKFLGLGAIEVISHPYQDYISKSASPLKPVVKKLSAPLLKELIIAPVLNFLTEKGFLIVAPPSESMFQSFLNSVNSALDFNWLSWGNSAEKSASLLKTAESYAPIIGNRIANGLTNSYGHTKGKAEILVDILDHISETTGVPYPIVCAGAGVASYMLFSYCYDRTFGVHNQNNNTNQISIHNHVQPQGQGASAQAHQKPKPNGYFSRWC